MTLSAPHVKEFWQVKEDNELETFQKALAAEAVPWPTFNREVDDCGKSGLTKVWNFTGTVLMPGLGR